MKQTQTTEMKKVASNNSYDYYEGTDENGKFYNIVPANSPPPNGGYAKEWIIGIKKCPDLFPGINTNFLKEWQPYDNLKRKVENTMLRHFIRYTYQFQATNEESSKKPFRPMTFTRIDETLGLAYTSTSAYAALWVCNSGYLWADPTHYFIGFAINEKGEVIGIADDMEENLIYIKL